MLEDKIFGEETHKQEIRKSDYQGQVDEKKLQQARKLLRNLPLVNPKHVTRCNRKCHYPLPRDVKEILKKYNK